MEFEEFRKIFLKESKINISDEKLECFYNYMKGILEWNSKINLTSITDEKEFVIKHFIDSITINEYVEKTEKLIDIGTGAGFPGVPLKIMNDNLNVTLIDSVNKKLNVIRDVSEKSKIKNLEIIHTRAEDLACKDEYREKYDIATTRAVSNISTISEYMLPFVKIGGRAICMKGPNFKEELDNAQKAIDILGGNVEKIISINVGNDLERNIVIIKKIKSTPKRYPRGQGKALKEPIR